MTVMTRQGRVSDVRKSAHAQLRTFRAERLRKRSLRQGTGGEVHVGEDVTTCDDPRDGIVVTPTPASILDPEDASFGVIPDLALTSVEPPVLPTDDLSVGAVTLACDDDQLTVGRLGMVVAAETVRGDDTGPIEAALPSADQVECVGPDADVQGPTEALAVDSRVETGDVTDADDAIAPAPCVPVPPGEAADGTENDLFTLPGAGPGLVWMLQRTGVRSLADLAGSNPLVLRRNLGLVGELLDLDWWISVARARVTQI